MTVPEAAQYLRIAVTTLYHWISDGTPDGMPDLPVKKMGRLVRFRRSELDVFIDECAA
jgi:excisionase family DNA binding protein